MNILLRFRQVITNKLIRLLDSDPPSWIVWPLIILAVIAYLPISIPLMILDKLRKLLFSLLGDE